MQDQIIIVCLTAALSLPTGFFLHALLQKIQRQNDDEVARIDDVCNMIEKLSDKATSYWLKSGESVDISESREIVMMNHRLGIMIDYIGQIDNLFVEKILICNNHFMNALTGGDFEVRSREVNPAQAQLIHVKATELIFKIRKVRFARNCWFWQKSIIKSI